MASLIEELKDKVRPTVARNRTAWRDRILSWLTAAMKKLDPSYEANARNIAAPANGASPAPASRLDVVTRANASRTIVMDEGGVVRGDTMLRLLLEAMFESQSLTGPALTLFERLRPTELWPSQVAVGEDAYKIALAEAGRVGNAAVMWSHAASRVAAFIENARKNATAYKQEGKLGPDVVFWPDPSHPKRPRPFAREIPIVAAEKIVGRDTPIGSAGSCFAMEIAHRLQEKKFNYVVTEPFPNPRDGLSDACARWGTIFNVPAFRQLVEKSFGAITLPNLSYTDVEAGQRRFFDPFREGVSYETIEEFESASAAHLAKAREALLRCKVFILTLGMNEVWRTRAGGYVLSRSPWHLASSLFNRQVLTVEENLSDLRRMVDVWRAHNPDIRFIVSVSPVPLHATFQGEYLHAIVANTQAKSTLRVVADEFARTVPGVSYFPSYESVMYCTENAWEADGRHVSRTAVDKVMALFDRLFVRDDA